MSASVASIASHAASASGGPLTTRLLHIDAQRHGAAHNCQPPCAAIAQATVASTGKGFSARGNCPWSHSRDGSSSHPGRAVSTEQPWAGPPSVCSKNDRWHTSTARAPSWPRNLMHLGGFT